MKQLWEIGYFLRALRARMRHGELSRAPLHLLRMEVHGKTAECEWLARPPDVWDSTLPRHLRDELASDQALRDAIELSDLFFETLPEVHEAEFRAFRQSAREPPRMVINGKLRREAPPVMRVPSLVMRAKMYGFHFWLNDGVLVPLDGEPEERGWQLLKSG